MGLRMLYLTFDSNAGKISHVANVEFDTNDPELVKFLRTIAAQYSTGQNRIGAGTGAKILLERLKDHPELIARLLESESLPKDDSLRQAKRQAG